MFTPKNILVPTDFSDNAAVVYDWAVQMARDYDAKINLIYVTPPLHYYPMGIDAAGFPGNETANEEFKESIDKKLLEHLNSNFPEEYRGKTISETGNAAERIKAVAKEGDYDLIMIASRGDGDSIFNKGSVTEKLMRISHVPVFSALNENKNEIKTITVPTDGSDVSLEALPLACELAVKRKASINLLTVSKVNFTHARFGEFVASDQDKTEVTAYIFDNLKRFIGENNTGLQFEGTPQAQDANFQLKDDKGNGVALKIVVKKGPSAHLTVVEEAENNSQMVVMATHGHSKLASMFVGSTTEKVFHNLEIPVLTVKPKFVK